VPKLPWFKFYPRDWLSDAALRSCSTTTRGAWIDLVCIMFDCEKRGILRTNGKPWSRDKIARTLGVRATIVDSMVTNSVLQMSERTGTYWSRRLVRDQRFRQRQARSGRKAALKRWAPNPMGSRKHIASPEVRSQNNTTLDIRDTKNTRDIPRPAARPRKPRKPDPIWDAVAALQYPPNGVVPKGSRTWIGGVVRDLRELDATPAEIRRRWRNIPKDWKGSTVKALVKHWATLAGTGSEWEREHGKT